MIPERLLEKACDTPLASSPLSAAITVLAVLWLLAGTASAFPAAESQATSTAALAVPACANQGVAVYNDFAGAAFESCTFDERGRLLLTIAPEDESINPSAWYAFRVSSDAASQLQVVLEYENGKHRYLPDISSSEQAWTALDEDSVTLNDDGLSAQFSVSLSAGVPLTVAAQPLLVSADYARWISDLSDRGLLSAEEVGRTPGDRPLWRVSTPPRDKTLLMLGRQHPPETTGALAMMAFLERLLEDDALAQAFRNEVGILAYPLLNPDGVDRGHWRHNTGSTDLNRDWGPFTQLETRTVAADADAFLQRNDTALIKSIDFHSTWYEVFYTQEDATARVESGLLGDWMTAFSAAMLARDPQFVMNRKPSHNADRPTAKSYFFERYGVASTTLEIGDATDAAYIRDYARVAAETFMSVWLQQS